MKSWQQRALAETDSRTLVTAVIALARNGDKSFQPKIVEALAKLDWSSLDRTLKLDLLRAYAWRSLAWVSPAQEISAKCARANRLALSCKRPVSESGTRSGAVLFGSSPSGAQNA